MADLSRDAPFDPKVMGGSIKRKIVNPALIEERAKCSFDKDEAYRMIFNADTREEFEVFDALLKKYPQLAAAFEYFEMSREEKMKLWWDRYKIIMSDPEFRHLFTNNSHKKSKYGQWYF